MALFGAFPSTCLIYNVFFVDINDWNGKYLPHKEDPTFTGLLINYIYSGDHIPIFLLHSPVYEPDWVTRKSN